MRWWILLVFWWVFVWLGLQSQSAGTEGNHVFLREGWSLQTSFVVRENGENI